MSIRDWLARLRPRAAGSVPVPQPAWLLRHPWLTEAGVPITIDTAVQVSAVYGCCRLIVDSLAAAPIHVYEVKSGGRREILHDDPVGYTLNWGAPISQSGDALTSQAIEEALFWSTLLDGNGYAEIQRDGAGKFYALWPIEPMRVQPWRDGDRFYYRVYATNSFGGQGGNFTEVEPSDMFHVRGPSLYGWVGDSPVYRASKAIGIAQAAQVFAAAYFANGTVISGLLSSDKAITKQQAEAAKAEWAEKFGGAAKAGGVAVTGQGLKYTPINHDAQQSQLVESRRFQVQEIARFFGVPTTLLADNEAWTNLSELYLGFYRNALLPWAERFDAEATRKLFPQRNPWREVRHDLTSLVMGSFKDQVLALREAVEGGLWTRNEARSVLNKNTLGAEGDVIVVNDKLRTLEMILEAPPPPLPAPQGPAPEGDKPQAAPMVPKKRAPADVARVAVALDRFAARMHARRKALDQKTADKRDANLAEERSRQMLELGPVLTEVGVAEMRWEEAANAVLDGEPAHVVAERLLA